MNKKILIILSLFASLPNLWSQQTNDTASVFPPETSRTSKPWTRWWWMGNAVDKKNLKENLIVLHNAGLGGVEITPIYGIKGEEENFIDYLSPKWMEMLGYTIHIADSLDMGVDMVLGTGWPYGGPKVSAENAATKLVVNKYQLENGERIKKNIEVDPEKEKNYTRLLYVLAFGEDGTYKNLTDELKGKFLNWKARKEDYTIYAVYAGKTGQMVKRAAPGGKGFTLDHYSEEALHEYLQPFNKALQGYEGKIHSIFNDSYEVYGTNFTPKFFVEFEKRRGYDLKPYLPLLLKEEDSEEANRVKSDYRETLSDLLLHNFDEPWTAWAHSKGFKSRLQAHGSPGNLIDLYASADTPECETFGSMPFDIPGFRRLEKNIREGDADPVMLKFSSSAAHISGKPLTSSETFTWLRDHFKTALSQTKPEAEELMLNGINHIYLHGNAYSPERAKWPGWKFYAAVNFSPDNTIWEDAPALFSYISNCQSLLQAGKADNQTLLYWPIYDVWGKYLDGQLFFQFKIHSLDEWLHETPFYKLTNDLMKKGFQLDFISDSYIAKAKVKDGKLLLPGGSYKTLVIPDTKRMKLATLQKLLSLKKQGANIIFQGLPETVPGIKNYKEETQELKKTLNENKDRIRQSSDIQASLKESGVLPESLVDKGLKYIRRDENGNKIYFLVNHTSEAIADFIPLNGHYSEVNIFDPLTGKTGKAVTKSQADQTLVKINLEPGKSLFLKTGEIQGSKNWKYYEIAGNSFPLDGSWNISFEKGGPELPEDTILTQLESWTKLSKKAEAFSGTASYQLEFDKPEADADSWMLNLGDVRESAKVWLNGKYIGDAWSVPFKINIGELKEGKNTLTLKITNLPANRVRDMELRGEEWKIFYEINMVDKDYKKFDATKWEPTPSGLLGPVSMTPLRLDHENSNNHN
ncbi:glycoside hydrolase [Christiangramia fulva]|uniref:Glycoside hydrolase n=1 Tax=Christiangramia fulva TaxID=2126553 RepID=A0A2R3Z5W2_9FLAO|nr:glycosyl hydrolase [Christiangramia fulva]AVR45602.1 glycoside hydrolase [Christiangramia fulva]